LKALPGLAVLYLQGIPGLHAGLFFSSGAGFVAALLVAPSRWNHPFE
jgi:hypothetical protein